MSHSDLTDGRNRDALLATLAWYRAVGVDAVVGDAPVDWLARGDVPPQRLQPVADRAAPSTRSTPDNRGAGRSNAGLPTAGAGSPPRNAQVEHPAAGAAARSFTPVAPDAAEADARQSAEMTTTLAELGAALARFDGCGLKATAKNLCFYRGAERARVMVIGEAPGRDEDRSGQPFVGRAGQLLDKMLAAIGLDEQMVHITNVVYWRPPGNRTPTPQEVLVCRPFLERQIALAGPDIIITVGGPAAKAILDVEQGITKTRGKWGTLDLPDGRSVRVMPTLHPAYLLRTPAAKRLAWRDLLAVRAVLDGEN
jgi:uracil-DNA glycosylase family 4